MKKSGHDGDCRYVLQPDGHQLRCVKSAACRPLWLMIAEIRERTLQELRDRGWLEENE